MLLVFKYRRTFKKPYQATQLMDLLAGFHARVGREPNGRYHVLVPSGDRPLAILRQLDKIVGAVEWELLGLNDAGDPVIPLRYEDEGWLATGQGVARHKAKRAAPAPGPFDPPE
jgi:hypothetical protein